MMYVLRTVIGFLFHSSIVVVSANNYAIIIEVQWNHFTMVLQGQT